MLARPRPTRHPSTALCPRPALRSAPGRALSRLARVCRAKPAASKRLRTADLRPATGAATLKAPRRASEPVKAAAKAAESAKLDDVLATAAMLSTQAFAVRKVAPGLAEAMRMAAATVA